MAADVKSERGALSGEDLARAPIRDIGKDGGTPRGCGRIVRGAAPAKEIEEVRLTALLFGGALLSSFDRPGNRLEGGGTMRAEGGVDFIESAALDKRFDHVLIDASEIDPFGKIEKIGEGATSLLRAFAHLEDGFDRRGSDTFDRPKAKADARLVRIDETPVL